MNLVLKTPYEAPYKAGKDFNVMILCEETTTARTCEVLEKFMRDLDRDEGRMLYQLWNIEALAFIELRELGAAAAATADMIIIGVPAERELPDKVAAWMKRCLDLRKGRPGALLAVLHADLKKPGAAQGMLSQLKQAAASGKMDFFTTEARVEKNAEDGRGDREAARQFVMAHKEGSPNGLPGRRRVPAEACGA